MRTLTAWRWVALLVLGLAITYGFAFTVIGIFGEGLVLASVVALLVGAVRNVRSRRRSKSLNVHP